MLLLNLLLIYIFYFGLSWSLKRKIPWQNFLPGSNSLTSVDLVPGIILSYVAVFSIQLFDEYVEYSFHTSIPFVFSLILFINSSEYFIFLGRICMIRLASLLTINIAIICLLLSRVMLLSSPNDFFVLIISAFSTSSHFTCRSSILLIFAYIYVRYWKLVRILYLIALTWMVWSFHKYSVLLHRLSLSPYIHQGYILI